MMENFPTFEDAIHAKGMIPPSKIDPEKIIRFPGKGKRRSNTSGWCILFLDGKAGCFGDWSQGKNWNWRAEGNKRLPKSEWAILKERFKAAKALAEREMRLANQKASEKATTLWERAIPAARSHAYLIKKQIEPHGARFSNGDLVIPLMNFEEPLTSLQFILPAGRKRFLKGGKQKGCFSPIGASIVDKEKVIICEGWATGCTLAENQPNALVLAALSASNLEQVAFEAREEWPDKEIIIAGDDDRQSQENLGKRYAEKAAIAADAFLAFPNFPASAPPNLSDFNDWATWQKGESMPSDLLIQKHKPENVWPDLVPLSQNTLAKMPDDLLPGWAGAFANALSKETETPLELTIAMVMASCSAATGRRLSVNIWEGFVESCLLWIIVALPPASRKSAVQSKATMPLRNWEKEQARAKAPLIKEAEHKKQILDLRIKELRAKAARQKDPMERQKISDEIQRLESSIPTVPKIPQLWTSDSTPEKLGMLLAENDECLAWLSSEGGIFDILQGRYSKGFLNLDLLLKAHNGESERVDRGNRPPIMLDAARLTVGLCPQPDVLAGLANRPGLFGRGLLARFLYLLPESNLGTRTFRIAPVPEIISSAYEAGIHAMLNWPRQQDQNGKLQPYVLKCSKLATDTFLQFAKEMEAEMLPGAAFDTFQGWAGKATGGAGRVAGIFHAIIHAHGKPWEEEISLETAQNAIIFMKIVANHSLAALDLLGADPTLTAARQVWEWVCRREKKSFSIREAFCDLRHPFPRVDKLEAALGTLEERGYLTIQKIETGKPGRPKSPNVLVRPSLVEGWN